MVNKDIHRMIYIEDLSFNLAKSPNFRKAMEPTGNFNKGYAPPSYHEARIAYLQKKVKRSRSTWWTREVD